MSVYEVMERIKLLLEDMDAKTLKIGLEYDISVDDFPLIRIVPNDNVLDTFDAWAEDIYFSIYIGELNSPDTQVCLKKLYDMEAKIKFKLHNFQWQDSGLIRFIKSSKSSDLEHYNVLVSEFKIESFRLF